MVWSWLLCSHFTRYIENVPRPLPSRPRINSWKILSWKIFSKIAFLREKKTKTERKNRSKFNCRVSVGIFNFCGGLLMGEIEGSEKECSSTRKIFFVFINFWIALHSLWGMRASTEDSWCSSRVFEIYSGEELVVVAQIGSDDEGRGGRWKMKNFFLIRDCVQLCNLFKKFSLLPRPSFFSFRVTFHQSFLFSSSSSCLAQR